MTTVILAEKPDQARSYMDGLGIKYKGKANHGEGKTFLDDRTIVVSAAGHLIELCEPEKYDEEYKDRDNMDILPLIPGRFEYLIRKDASSLFSTIKKNVESADRIIVATDKDNEGAAIAHNILRFTRSLKYKKIQRAYPSALNKTAVVRQFKHIEPIDQTWRNAQAAAARSRADWLIGMNLSRLYTHQLKLLGINNNFAIGRVTSAVLNLICQWYQEIEDFQEQPVYELKGGTVIHGQKVIFSTPIKYIGKLGTDRNDVENKRGYALLLKQHGIVPKGMVMGTVKVVNSDIKEKQPPILMTKGDLYREMSRVYGWSQDRSKKVMQANYEQGYQTYPRTDSGLITQYMYDYLHDGFDKYLEAIGMAGKFERYEYPPEKLKRYLTSEESAGAHMAIIPTEQIMTKESNVTDDQRLMYEVVVRKSLTLLLKPYKYVSNQLGVMVNDVPFTAQNSGMLDNGWKELLLPSKSSKKRSQAKNGNSDQEQQVLDFSQYVQPGQQIKLAIGHKASKTKPLPPLKTIQIYDKGGLMEKAYKYVEDEKYAKILRESNGIGTSATRDQAMASLIAKNYVSVDSKDVITVTPEGWLINHLLQGSEVNSPLLTAKWEEEYKLIEKGKAKPNDLINATAKMIFNEFHRVDDTWNPESIQEYYASKNSTFYKELSVGPCPKCGADVIFNKDKRHKGQYDCYECTNDECTFRVFSHFSNKNVSQTEFTKLLKGSPTKKYTKIEAKSGRTYDARFTLHYDKAKDRYRLGIYKEKQTY